MSDVLKADILRQLKENGYKARIVSVRHLSDLKDEIETNYRNGLYDEGLYRDYLSKFAYAPPENARSIIVMAWKQYGVRFVFNWNGRRVPAVVPASYLHTVRDDTRSQETLAGILAPNGYSVSRVALPKKLLAARSGLVTYGRNNITYVDDMGSFHRLNAFYSDVPCEEDGEWREPGMLERCRDCRICVDHCPSGAIGMDRFLIHVEKCVTFHNEKPGNVPFPEWLDPSLHNCLVGCMRCQNVCPENKPFIGHTMEGVEFSADETGLLLSGTPAGQMPAELAKKLEEQDMMELLDVIPRNLGALLNRKK